MKAYGPVKLMRATKSLIKAQSDVGIKPSVFSAGTASPSSCHQSLLSAQAIVGLSFTALPTVIQYQCNQNGPAEKGEDPIRWIAPRYPGDFLDGTFLLFGQWRSLLTMNQPAADAKNTQRAPQANQTDCGRRENEIDPVHFEIVWVVLARTNREDLLTKFYRFGVGCVPFCWFFSCLPSMFSLNPFRSVQKVPSPE